ncbi:hypothetical protein [Halobaculum sp. P14]|uniref:hypothetical protein n=1 Tax=Halobaculum sp. P14 TaxID=3421638 RepID=UPI003EB90EF8
MSDESSEPEGTSALDHGESSTDHAKHWSNKADQGATLPADDVDVKSDWVGMTIYLPEDLREELELVFQEHNLECKRSNSVDLKKLRYYYPLVVALGLERVKSTSTDDILPLLSYITDEYE